MRQQQTLGTVAPGESIVCPDGGAIRAMSGSTIRMDGPVDLREILITARDRLENRASPKPTRRRARVLREIVRDRVARWCRRILDPPRGRSVAPIIAGPDENPCDEENALRDSQRDRLLKALYSLPPGDFDLLMMRHVDHKSTEQIAITMGITEQTVKSRLLRALFSLRKSLSS